MIQDLIEINTKNADVWLAMRGYLTPEERETIVMNTRTLTDKFEKERKKLRTSIPPRDEVYLIGMASYEDKKMRLILGSAEDYQRIVNEKRRDDDEIILGGTLGGRVI